MATKHFCDGCGTQLLGSNLDVASGQDGIVRRILMRVGGGEISWVICPPCANRALSALAETLPVSRGDAETWHRETSDAIARQTEAIEAAKRAAG
jgi:hypothetical protein